MAILHVSWDKQNPITYAWEIENDEAKILYLYGPSEYPFVINGVKLFDSLDDWRKTRDGTGSLRVRNSEERITELKKANQNVKFPIWLFLKNQKVKLSKIGYLECKEDIASSPFAEISPYIYNLLINNLLLEASNRWEVTARSDPKDSDLDSYIKWSISFITTYGGYANHFHFVFERPDFVRKAANVRTEEDEKKAYFWASTLVTLHNTINLYRYFLFITHEGQFDHQGSGPIVPRLQKRLVDILQQDTIPECHYNGLESVGNNGSNIGSWKFFNVGFRNNYEQDGIRNTNLIGFEYRTPLKGENSIQDFFDSVKQGELQTLQSFDFSKPSQDGAWGMKRLEEILIPELSKSIKEFLGKYFSPGVEIVINIKYLTEQITSLFYPVFFCDIVPGKPTLFYELHSVGNNFRKLFSIEHADSEEKELEEEAVASIVTEIHDSEYPYRNFLAKINGIIEDYIEQYKSDLDKSYKNNPGIWLEALNELQIKYPETYVDEYNDMRNCIEGAVSFFYNEKELPIAINVSSEHFAAEILIYRISLPYLKHIRYHPGINNQKRAKDAFDDYHNSLCKYFANKPDYEDLESPENITDARKKFVIDIQNALKAWATQSGIIDALKITNGIQKHYYLDGTQVGSV
jgi:hypothetical protein